MVDLTGHLQIHYRDLDDLVAALRRHDRSEATRLLERWAISERNADEEVDEDVLEDPDWFPLHLDHDLSAWVHHESTIHVAEGRFEYALCLVESYRRPDTVADKAARISLTK